MKLLEDLKRARELLSAWPGAWAVCGGVAAAVYRDTPRYTADIDIALIDTSDKTAKAIAAEIAGALGYRPQIGFVTDQHGRLIKEEALVIGREDHASGYVGIDFLLPVLPWIRPAVQRAQANLLDFGFAKLPTVTVEDLFVAKLFALQGTPERHADLDDLTSMARARPAFDEPYFRAQLKAHGLQVPAELERLLRQALSAR